MGIKCETNNREKALGQNEGKPFRFYVWMYISLFKSYRFSFQYVIVINHNYQDIKLYEIGLTEGTLEKNIAQFVNNSTNATPSKR